MTEQMISGFHYVYLPGDDHSPVILALHGTGGDEHDLAGLAQNFAPGWGVLSPRGKVLENGMNRFFRRLKEGVFDLEDLRKRTEELAEFISAAREAYHLGGRALVAAGFSNGANIAASLMLQRPEILDGAVLLRAMTPFTPETPPQLAGKAVLMLSGAADPIVPADNAAQLAQLLAMSGAEIRHDILPASHHLTQDDLKITTEWLRRWRGRK